jgi:hypothetical protein
MTPKSRASVYQFAMKLMCESDSYISAMTATLSFPDRFQIFVKIRAHFSDRNNEIFCDESRCCDSRTSRLNLPNHTLHSRFLYLNQSVGFANLRFDYSDFPDCFQIFV